MRNKRPSKRLAQAVLAVVCAAITFEAPSLLKKIGNKIDGKYSDNSIKSELVSDGAAILCASGEIASIVGTLVFGYKAAKKEEYYYTFY